MLVQEQNIMNIGCHDLLPKEPTVDITADDSFRSLLNYKGANDFTEQGNDKYKNSLSAVGAGPVMSDEKKNQSDAFLDREAQPFISTQKSFKLPLHIALNEITQKYQLHECEFNTAVVESVFEFTELVVDLSPIMLPEQINISSGVTNISGSNDTYLLLNNSAPFKKVGTGFLEQTLGIVNHDISIDRDFMMPNKKIDLTSKHQNFIKNLYQIEFWSKETLNEVAEARIAKNYVFLDKKVKTEPNRLLSWNFEYVEYHEYIRKIVLAGLEKEKELYIRDYHIGKVELDRLVEEIKQVTSDSVYIGAVYVNGQSQK